MIALVGKITERVTVEIPLKRNVAVAIFALVAALLGIQIAEGSLLAPLVCAFLIGLLCLSRLLRVGSMALCIGLLVVGYMIGNRGFAQLSPVGLPLFPGELILGLSVVCAAWMAARQKVISVERSMLGALVLSWILLGFTRAPMDVRSFGFLAVRDLAMVYYALYFFLVQIAVSDPAAKRWITRCILAGMALCTPSFIAFQIWPEFFIDHLLIAGIPLIFVKSDVAGGFMAAAGLWFLVKHAHQPRWRWLALSALALAGAAMSNSRAALLSLLIGFGWLIAMRQARAIRTAIILGGLALSGLAANAALSAGPFSNSVLYRLYESVLSITDFDGTMPYQSVALGDKSDNNRFRAVWWESVIAETTETNPVFGRGFGADLAGRFLATYDAVSADDFSARSPHSFIITVYGRMGILGTVAVLGWILAMAAQTWRARTAADPDTLGAWLAAWAIFISGCFGVVLESPMGAIVFWVVAGLAHSLTRAQRPETDDEPASGSEETRDPTLQRAQEPAMR